MKRKNSLLRLLMGIVPLALFLAMSVSTLHAQGRGGADDGPRADRSGWMMQQLDLTEGQQTQINDIVAAHRAERLERRQSVRDKISEVLTPEQREQFEELQNQRPSFRGQGMRGQGMRSQGMRSQGMRGQGMRGTQGPRGGGPGMYYGRDYTAQQLDLTPEQQTQLDAIRQEHFAVRQEWLRENPTATRADHLAWRNAMQADMLEAAASFLTPEQLEQLETVQSTRPRGRF